MAKLKFDDDTDFGDFNPEVNTEKQETLQLGSVVEIPIELIDIGENIRNVNEDDEFKLRQLGDSIKSDGQIEPCIVYQEGDRYIIKAGSRRYKACVLSDIPVLKCVIDKKFKDKKERIIYQATENEHRDDMNPREREKYMSELLELGMNQNEIAKALHKNKGWVSEALTAHNLLNENNDLQEIIDEDTSTRDVWKMSKLEEDELAEVKKAVKEKGGGKKALKEELDKKLKSKKEKEPDKTELEEENNRIDREFGIEFEIDDGDSTSDYETSDDYTITENEESTLGFSVKYKLNENTKKATFSGNEKEIKSSDFGVFLLAQAEKWLTEKGYIVQ